MVSRPIAYFSIVALYLGACTSPRVAPEVGYFATKDSVQRALAPRQQANGFDPALVAADDSARRMLASRLRTIVGPFRAAGFADTGQYNVETLLSDMNSGSLDAIRYRAVDSATRVLVTTPQLLEHWVGERFSPLRPHGADYVPPRIPSDPPLALLQRQVYNDAWMGPGAAVVPFADIAIDSTARDGLVRAMVVARAQDICKCTPTEVVMGVIRGNRIFIVYAPARDTIPPMPPCVAAWDSGGVRSHAIIDAYVRAGSTDKRQLGRAFQAGLDADALYRRCYAERAPREPGYVHLVAQVKEILARLPAK